MNSANRSGAHQDRSVEESMAGSDALPIWFDMVAMCDGVDARSEMEEIVAF